jgi:hypothetical protein
MDSNKDLMVLIGGAEKWAAIQWKKSMWLKKGGDGNFERRFYHVLSECWLTLNI